MVAEVVVMPAEVTAEITGGPAALVVVKVKFPEVVDRLDALAEIAAKSYVVPGVNPERVTE